MPEFVLSAWPNIRGLLTLIAIVAPAGLIFLLESNRSGLLRLTLVVVLPVCMFFSVASAILYASPISLKFVGLAQYVVPFIALAAAAFQRSDLMFGLLLHMMTYFAGYLGKGAGLIGQLGGIRSISENPEQIPTAAVYLIGRSLGADLGGDDFAVALNERAQEATGLWDIYVMVSQVISKGAISGLDAILPSEAMFPVIAIVGYLLNFMILSTSAVLLAKSQGY